MATLPIPRFLIGDSTPFADYGIPQKWIICTNPFLAGLVEHREETAAIRIHLWQPQWACVLPGSHLFHVAQNMARISSQALDIKPLSDNWEYVVGTTTPPDHLICNSPDDDAPFRAILRLKEPGMWIVLDNEHQDIPTFVYALDSTADYPDMKYIQESWQWWKEYQETEAQSYDGEPDSDEWPSRY